MDQKRYALLDAIRGFAVLNMILYHALWDLVYIVGFHWAWYGSKWAYFWQQCICWIFIFLSGFCFLLGRRALKRGLTVFFAGAAVSLVTVCLLPENQILFGILTLIGSCMLWMIPAEKYLSKCRPLLGFWICLALFFLTRNINIGYLGFEGIHFFPLPQWLYQNLATAYLGFPAADFYSTDYFSLFPWIFLYGSGYFFYRHCKQKSWLDFLTKSVSRPAQWIGRHSLVIYLAHQPLLYLLCEVFFSPSSHV